MRTCLALAALLFLAVPSFGQYREYNLPDGSRIGVYALGTPGHTTYAWYRQLPNGKGYGRASSVGPFSAPLTVEKWGDQPTRAVETMPSLRTGWAGAWYGRPWDAPPYYPYYPRVGPVLRTVPVYPYPW